MGVKDKKQVTTWGSGTADGGDRGLGRRQGGQPLDTGGGENRLSQNLQKETSPVTLDFRFPASRTLREGVSVVVSHPVCSACFSCCRK